MKKTAILLLSMIQLSYAWDLHTFNSRKSIDLITNVPTPQQCEIMAKSKWDEYKTIYSSWEREHMQFNTWCTAKAANKCYEWVIKCPNASCTTDKFEGKC